VGRTDCDDDDDEQDGGVTDPETLRELRALFKLYDIDDSGRRH